MKAHKKIKLSVNDNKCDVSISKSLLPIVSDAAAKVIVNVLKNQKWTTYKSLIKLITHHQFGIRYECHCSRFIK